MGFDRNLHISLARHLRAVGDAGEDVALIKLRVLLDDLFARQARRQQIENQRNPDAVPANAGLAETSTRIDPDSG